METSLFIARIAGPILIVTGLSAIINPRLLEEVGREFIASRAMLFLGGIGALVIGLVIINTHNVWVAGWPVIITIFGWMAIAGGCVRIGCPSLARKVGATMLAKRSFLIASALFQLAFGLWLSWAGYF